MLLVMDGHAMVYRAWFALQNARPMTLRKAGEDGTVVCMHAENGVVIDELVKLALRKAISSRNITPTRARPGSRPRARTARWRSPKSRALRSTSSI